MLSDSQVWALVKELQGKTVYTFKRHSPNKILNVTDTKVKIDNRTTEPSRKAIKYCYETLYTEGRLTLGKNGNFPIYKMYVILAILRDALKDKIDIIEDGISVKNSWNCVK